MEKKMLNKPEEVRRARINGDAEALSAMGKVGAKVAAENRAFREANRNEVLEERIRELAKTEHVDSDGDVLPPKEFGEMEN